jgi:hypothetical protein
MTSYNRHASKRMPLPVTKAQMGGSADFIGRCPDLPQFWRVELLLWTPSRPTVEESDVTVRRRERRRSNP